jgi:hypothetical protein
MADRQLLGHAHPAVELTETTKIPMFALEIGSTIDRTTPVSSKANGPTNRRHRQSRSWRMPAGTRSCLQTMDNSSGDREIDTNPAPSAHIGIGIGVWQFAHAVVLGIEFQFHGGDSLQLRITDSRVGLQGTELRCALSDVLRAEKRIYISISRRSFSPM